MPGMSGRRAQQRTTMQARARRAPVASTGRGWACGVAGVVLLAWAGGGSLASAGERRGRSGGSEVSVAPESADAVVLVCAMGGARFAGDALVRPRAFLRADVARSLELSEDEKRKLAELDAEIDARVLPTTDPARAGPPPAIQAPDEIRRYVAGVVRPAQLARLQAMIVRDHGLWFVPLEQLRRALQLDQAQTRTVHAIRERTLAELDRALPPRAPSGERGRCRAVDADAAPVKRLLAAADAATLAALSPEQAQAARRFRAGPSP